MKRSGMEGGLHSLQSSILFLTEKRGRRSMAREDEKFYFTETRDKEKFGRLADAGGQDDTIFMKFFVTTLYK